LSSFHHTHFIPGKLEELIDIIVEEKAALFVCAVGVPSVEVVRRLHDAGIFVMNVRSSSRLREYIPKHQVRWLVIRNMSQRRSRLVSISSVLKVEREEDIQVCLL
jgi:hypothetical protein